jgi:hypothetical protein
MGGNLALREQESAEISEGRRQRLFLVLGRDPEEPAISGDAEEIASVVDIATHKLVCDKPVDKLLVTAKDNSAENSADPPPDAWEEQPDWASQIPDELIVAAAVLGACIGFPIGTAAAGVVVGFFGGVLGALVGATTVLAIARYLDPILHVVLVLLGSAIVYVLTHQG